MNNDNTSKIANIHNSIWVAASAGSGKTTVLVRRLLSLILNGVTLEKLVCLTYTKTGALEMKERILKALANWATADDDELENNLHETLGVKPTEEQRRRARVLFAKVLDNMDNLRIFTIHAFCQQLLVRFPLEAGITPNFQIIDDYQSKNLLRQVMEDLLLDDSNSSIQKSLKLILEKKNEDDFYEFMEYLVSKRKNFEMLRKFDYKNELKEQLNPAGLEEAELNKNFFMADRRNLFHICNLLEDRQFSGNKWDNLQSKILKMSGKIENLRNENLEEYLNIFLTKKREKRKNIVNNSEKLDECVANSSEILLEEQRRCYDYVQEKSNLSCFELSIATIDVVLEVIDRYGQLKSQRGLLDFNDLIVTTLKLLQDTEYAAWISYKLDSGIEHLLVDEAQDTSALQWEIVKCLTDDFFSGKGGNENPRSIFVVGDEKQSIFRFQDADPQMFRSMYDFYRDTTYNARSTFYRINLNYSFRSVATILNFVDAVFKNHSREISFMEANIRHNCLRNGTGLVELWPLISVEKVDRKPWSFNFDEDEEVKKQELLARYVVNKIVDLTSGNSYITDLSGQKRPIVPGDIMILVKSRNSRSRESPFLFYLLEQLNANAIANSGLDRIDLFGNLVVSDLISLLTFLVFPNDDLSLANIVKSPILGLTENDLYELCRHRTEKNITLFEAMKAIRQPSYDFLIDIYEKSRNVGIHKLCFYILEELDVRRAIINRFGADSNNVLNKFLDFIDVYEREKSHSLLSLLHFIENNSKNRISTGQIHSKNNQVRIMTVHGSKGLQAPIVFLADVNSAIDVGKEKIFWHRNSNNREIPICKINSDEDSNITKEIKKDAENELQAEYYRLLYVALTRAENQLYLCGLSGRNSGNKAAENGTEEGAGTNSSGGTWYELLKEAMEDLGARSMDFDYVSGEKKFLYGEFAMEDDTDNIPKDENRNVIKGIDGDAMGDGGKYENGREGENLSTGTNKMTTPNSEEQRILQHIRKYDAVPPKAIISPSQFFNYSDRDDILNAGETMAIVRGNAVHKLLEILPKTPRKNWNEIVNLYMDNSFSQLRKNDRDELKKNVFALLDEEKFRLFFSENSHGEVEIAGEVDGFLVSGRIDRLVLQEDRVSILDYKNTARDYKTVADLPKEYVKQLELYGKLIKKLYPQKSLDASILLVSTGRLIRVE